MLTVNIGESKALISSFMQANNYDFPVLLDGDAQVTLRYGVSGIPATFFIDRAGIISYIKRGQFFSLSELQSALDKIT